MPRPPPLIADLIAASQAHDLDRLSALHALDYQGMDVARKEPLIGRAGARAALVDYLQAFPDVTWTTEQVLHMGNCLVLRWSAVGTHQGVLMHIPATGRRVHVAGVSILHLRDGLIWRGQTIWDVAGLLRGLGLLPDL
jgi:steroid delta-isomerase-like uncharacterized protein